MTKPAAPLVGRERELELLERALANACEGLARVVALSGEPGIGKSRLLHELARKANARDCLVLEGRAAEFERELPFGVLLDACDEYLESIDGRTAERLAGDGLAELATVFPSLRSLVPDPAPVALAHERYRAHRAVREMLERLAKRQPLVLVLDDLHWADEASIELIAHLVRRPPRAGVAVACAYRSGQAPALLVRAVDSISAEAGLERIGLGPLRADEAERLVESLDPSERELLYRESGGNPFYLEQLARAPSRVGGPRPEATFTGDGSGAPAAVIAAISQELHQLPGQARTLAQAAAVAGDPFEIDVAAEAAGVGQADALLALDELLVRGVARPTEAPRRFRFRHPLVRRAIYESCGAGWRLGAHARAARALHDRGASATQRAHHVAAAARPGDREALALLSQAGRAVASRAPATAARWYGAALDLLPEGSPDDGTRLELLAGLGTALGAAGRLPESHAALVQALDALPDKDNEQRVRLLEMCVSTEQVMGRHVSARERVVRALADFPAADSPQAVRLKIALATTSLYSGDFERMRDEAARALSAALDLPDAALQAYARAVLAFGAYRGGRIDEARRELAQAVADSARLADGQLAELEPSAFLAMGSVSRFFERFEEADGLLKRGIDVSRLRSRGDFLLPLLSARAATSAALGRVTEAVGLSEDALDSARLSPSSLAEMMALRSRSWAAYLAGDLVTALAAGEQSQALMNAVDESHLSSSVPVGLAAALLETGAERRAMELILDSGRDPELAGALIAERCLCYELLVGAALSLGQWPEARDWAERADAVAIESGLSVTACHAGRARAAVLLASDDAAGAAGTALEAAEAADGVGARLDAARSRTLAGKALRAAGERDRAIAELEAAEVVLADCGAERFHQEAVRELRRLGRRPASRSRRGALGAAGIESLSGRELEVAMLVVDRKTNPEIAADLFLSTKTVESHLRNIFRKLDVSSRVELARAVERAMQR